MPLQEDIGPGDVTSEATIRAESASEAVMLAKQDLVLAGLDVAGRCFIISIPDIQFTPYAKDGDRSRRDGDREAVRATRGHCLRASAWR